MYVRRALHTPDSISMVFSTLFIRNGNEIPWVLCMRGKRGGECEQKHKKISFAVVVGGFSTQ